MSVAVDNHIYYVCAINDGAVVNVPDYMGHAADVAVIPMSHAYAGCVGDCHIHASQWIGNGFD